MRIYFISPINSETKELFPTFIPTFESKGHSVVTNWEDADVAFIDLFSYLNFNWPLELVKCWEKNIPLIYWDARDYGAMSKEVFPMQAIHIAAAERKIIYFVRKMDKTVTYPKCCYPYELTQYPGHEFEPTTKEELFNRPIEICFIGNKSDSRVSVTNGLKDYFKCDFVIAQPRLEHDVWLNRHRQSKLFLVADGAGFNDERAYQLIYISALLKQRNNQLVINDFEDGIDCIKSHEYPNGLDIENIKYVLNEPDLLYEIYLKGIEKMKTYFNAEYRSLYILKILSDNGIN